MQNPFISVKLKTKYSINNQSQKHLITFSRQLLRLFSQKANFQTNSLKDFYQQKQSLFHNNCYK